MNDLLSEKLKQLPLSSGVYVMQDENGNVIYVGKAKVLKNRVSQYFRAGLKANHKVHAMVKKVFMLDWFVTPTERDAFLLENNLIKKYQPFYNILLKDGKQFPYLKINLHEPYPRLEITRKVSDDGAKYFGPYLAGISANKLLDVTNFAFKLRTCTNTTLKHSKRACLNFSLGRCPAPCIKNISEEEYFKNVKLAIDFLNGDSKQIEQILKQKMMLSAEAENFERANEIKELLAMVQMLSHRTIAGLPRFADLDVFAFSGNGMSGAIAELVVRGGKINGVQTDSVIDASLNEGQILSTYILAYYKNQKIPKLILVSHQFEGANILEELLKTKIICPKSGYKKHLVDMATKNAIEHLDKNLSTEKRKFNSTIGAIMQLQNALELKSTPKRIECYDISNTSGTLSVGSMVVFENGQKAAKMYRKFKIKTIEGPNDFASLKEVLARRIGQLKEQKDESFSRRPDLIVIDGGKGQLSSVMEVVQSLDPTLQIISLAKQFEEVYMPNSSVPIMLKRGSVELKLLTAIRDEAHRYAITFHRILREKNMLGKLKKKK